MPNVVRAAEFYRDKLGFEILGYFLDPPVYAMVRRGPVEIHFGKSDGDEVRTNRSSRKGIGSDAYIFVSDVRALFDELSHAGVEIIEGPVEREYDCTEVVVKDCFGFVLVFAD